MTPTSPFNMPFSPALKAIPDFTLGPAVEGFQQTIHDVGAPLSPFHYQLRKVGHLYGQAECSPGEYPISRRRSTSSSEPTSTDG